MTYAITKYKSTDELQLKNTLASLQEGVDILYITRSSNCKHALVAYEQGIIVGMIVAWKSSFHPNCTYLTCIAHHTDCAEALLVELERHLEQQDYPLQTIVDENARLNSFYQESWFTIIRSTYVPTINLKDYQDSYSIPCNQVVKQLPDILSNSNLVNQLVTLVKRNYEETHLDNPVADFELAKWKSMIFAEDLIASGSFVCLDQNEENILAYSFLHEAGKQDTVELGWCGVLHKEDIAAIPALVNEQIDFSRSSGYTYLTGEFDTTSIYAMEVLTRLSFPKNPVWITYQKRGVQDFT